MPQRHSTILHEKSLVLGTSLYYVFLKLLGFHPRPFSIEPLWEGSSSTQLVKNC